MSCNGCRVLRKGCSESCILRPCLQWIENPEAQGHATVFVAKFFGRACLMSFISNVSETQRPALFQSLLFEACGRTVNPVNGAVGLLWTGNWHVCQAAVDTVLRGGNLTPLSGLFGMDALTPGTEEASETEVTCTEIWSNRDQNMNYRFMSSRFNGSSTCSGGKRKNPEAAAVAIDLDLRLTPILLQKVSDYNSRPENRRQCSPSMTSEESVTTVACSESGNRSGERKVLNLFI
ncbi:hypothetical protein Lal_00041552 [Lupinus albus]|uniref:Putative transcription factor AS2-LOB family n=1 Tax=Lupinus albus TaxID=3870 RepID=A0A6A5MNP8_LUPAL|nr:putative transcription factor AS2-LOB family [Lupinus albus]KAF1874108.1 hypothetical protein Lal_00041552 [Lupinus albus]